MAEPRPGGHTAARRGFDLAPVGEVAAAVVFLTRVRVPAGVFDPERSGIAAFAVVGAAIGLAAAAPVAVLGPWLPTPAAVLAILVVAVISGGMHLDGLADTADALAAASPDAAERARTDPRVGAAGVIALVLAVLLEVSLLAAIAAERPLVGAAAVVIAATWSRAAAPIAAWLARRLGTAVRGTLGTSFSSRIRSVDAIAAVAAAVGVTVALVVAVGATGLLIGVGAGLVVAAAASAGVVATRRQLDGDGYGTIVEVTFTALLAGIAIQVAAP